MARAYSGSKGHENPIERAVLSYQPSGIRPAKQVIVFGARGVDQAARVGRSGEPPTRPSVGAHVGAL
ncbi:MAG TPA: hypothetical protein VF881_17370, partial [Polyangiaceae bacterium]